jgi:hypothetical protein
LAFFAWLLTLHPSAAGRTYAAYGGVYIAIALGWLRVIDGVALTRWDVLGAGDRFDWYGRDHDATLERLVYKYRLTLLSLESNSCNSI